MPALIVVEASKAMMQIAAGEETLEDFGFDWPMDQAGGIEFTAMLANTLIERACLWIARTVDAARHGCASLRIVVSSRPWLGTKDHAYQRRQPGSTDKTDQSMMIGLQKAMVGCVKFA